MGREEQQFKVAIPAWKVKSKPPLVVCGGHGRGVSAQPQKRSKRGYGPWVVSLTEVCSAQQYSRVARITSRTRTGENRTSRAPLPIKSMRIFIAVPRFFYIARLGDAMVMLQLTIRR